MASGTTALRAYPASTCSSPVRCASTVKWRSSLMGSHGERNSRFARSTAASASASSTDTILVTATSYTLSTLGSLHAVPLCGWRRSLDPAMMFVAGDFRRDEASEGRVIDPGEAGAHRPVVDLAGDNEQQRAVRCSEGGFDARGVEQAEGNVQCFAVASVVVVVDFPCVHDGADPELAVSPARSCEGGVVAGQKLAEGRDGLV